MLRTYFVAGAAIALGLGATFAQAHETNEWHYVVGGALIGAVIGELAYDGGDLRYRYRGGEFRPRYYHHRRPPAFHRAWRGHGRRFHFDRHLRRGYRNRHR